MSAYSRLSRLARIASVGQWLAEGRAWYPTARRLVEVESDFIGLSRPTIAGAIAALSPQVSWPTQTRYLRRFLLAERAYPRTGEHPGYRPNLVKASRIIHGETPESVLGGPKVRAFYFALNGDDSALVLDRHAIAAATGRQSPQELRKSERAEIERAYRRTARDLGLDVCSTQAALWLLWRDLYNVAWSDGGKGLEQ